MARLRLDSWKSIAEYLRRSPRTVQRWHAEFGLPVHHFGGGKGPVFSYSDELDAWLSGFVEDAGGDRQGGDDDLIAARKARSAELVAQAEELWDLRSENNLSTIASLYRGAVDQNPANAPAFIGMANAIILSAMMGAMRGSAAFPRAAEAVQRALRLGFDGPETRCATAWLQLAYERKWRRAREGFEEVLQYQPRSSHALTGRGVLQAAQGSLDAAARDLEEAGKQYSLASVCTSLLCWVQYLARDFEQAMDTAAQASAGGDNGAITAAVEAFALIQSGIATSSLRRLEGMARTFSRSLVIQGALGYAYAVSDHAGRAREMLHNLNRMKGESLYPIALVLIGLNEKSQAMVFLEQAYAEGSLWSLGFRSDPILQPLRDDSRYEARLRKLGHSN